MSDDEAGRGEAFHNHIHLILFRFLNCGTQIFKIFSWNSGFIMYLCDMKTKEEVIKDAWGEEWNDLPTGVQISALKNNGYINQNIEVETECDIFCPLKRPKSLQGLEDNNGWIRIESEEDLPKDSYNYWIRQSDGIITSIRQYDDNKKYWNVTATHYQPIVKPKEPLY